MTEKLIDIDTSKTCEDDSTLQITTAILSIIILAASTIVRIIGVKTENYINLYTDSDQNFSRLLSVAFWKDKDEYFEIRDGNRYKKEGPVISKNGIYRLLMLNALGILKMVVDIPYVVVNQDFLSWFDKSNDDQKELDLPTGC